MNICRGLARGAAFAAWLVAIGAAGESPGAPCRILVASDDAVLLIDVAIWIDGRPHDAYRSQIIEMLRVEADANRDDHVSIDEAAASRIGRLGLLAYLARSDPASQLRRLRLADEDDDGLLSREELQRAFALHTGSELFRHHEQPLAVSGYYVEQAVFQQLDRNADGAISAIEARKAGPTLELLDRDGNHLVDTAELAAAYHAKRPAVAPPVARVQTLVLPHALPDASAVDRTRAWLATAACRRFRGGRIDTNGDAVWEDYELRRLRSVEPDARVAVRFGRDGAAGCVVEGHSNKPVTTSHRGGAATIHWPDLLVQVVAIDSEDQPAEPHLAASLAAFMQWDADGNGSIERGEVAAASDNANDSDDSLLAQFESWDVDGNGSATPEEITDSLEFYGVPAPIQRVLRPSRKTGAINRGTVQLMIQDYGSSLFPLLDQNSDLELGQRELAKSGEVLASLPKQGGEIKKTAFPKYVRVAVTRELESPLRFAAPFPAWIRTLEIVRGEPAWFRAMDRNGDGDLSREEFLGDSARFQQLDRDRDGFISTAEAAAEEP